MQPPEKYSETNVLNSLSLYVATKLLAANYLLYWQYRDALQAPSGWYPQWQANKLSYLVDVTLAAEVANAQGLLTIVGAIPAVPRYVTRLIDDTSVGPPDEVSVPTFSIEVGAAIPGPPYELGTKVRWRSRHLIIDSYARTEQESRRFKDFLALWFDADLLLQVVDHDAGDLADVGSLAVMDTSVHSATVLDGVEATTYEVLLHAGLIYVA